MGIDARRSHRARRRAVLQLQGDGATADVSRVLYFDCFSGHLRRHGARRAARRRPAARRAEAGARQPGAVRATTSTAERVLRAGVSATKFRVHRARARDGRHRHAITRTHHDHAHASPARPSRIASIRIAACRDLRADRPLGAVAGGARRARRRCFSGWRGRSGDSPDAGREGPPARSRRARLDHRHRRRRVRARVGRRRPHRLLAAERRRRHGAVGARPVSGAGAGDGEAARRRARSTAARSRRSW